MFESCWLDFSRYFSNHPSDSVCSGVGANLVGIVLSIFLLGFLYDFCVFALRSLKAFRLMVVDSLLNFRKAALCKRMVVLQSSLNQGVLCLFEVEAFAIVLFAVEVKCFVWSMMLGSCDSFCLQGVSKTCQFVLFIFQWGSLSSWKGCKHLSIIGKWSLLHYGLSTHNPYSLQDHIKLDQWLSKSLWMGWGRYLICYLECRSY